MRRRLLLILVLVVALATLSAPAVFAAAPWSNSWTNEPGGPLMLTGICSFDITVNYVSSGTYTEWDNADGSGMALLHSSEQDTFTANGTSLTGDWYTNTVHVAWTSDGPTKVVVTGGIEEINLPDGSRFWSAGLVNHLGRPGDIVTPDRGHSGNVAALCAALAL